MSLSPPLSPTLHSINTELDWSQQHEPAEEDPLDTRLTMHPQSIAEDESTLWTAMEEISMGNIDSQQQPHPLSPHPLSRHRSPPLPPPPPSDLTFADLSGDDWTSLTALPDSGDSRLPDSSSPHSAASDTEPGRYDSERFNRLEYEDQRNRRRIPPAYTASSPPFSSAGSFPLSSPPPDPLTTLSTQLYYQQLQSQQQQQNYIMQLQLQSIQNSMQQQQQTVAVPIPMPVFSPPPSLLS